MIEIGLTALLAVVGWLIAHLAIKLEKSIDALSKSIEALKTELSDSTKRQDVQDVVLSALIKDSFNSAGIVANKTRWPRNMFDDGSDNDDGPSRSNGKKK